MNKAIFSEIVSAERIKTLLEAGADPDTRLQYNQTPLMIAASHPLEEKYEEIMLELIKHGANVHLTDVDKQNALYRTVSGCNETLTKILLDHGAKVNAADKDGDTPLMVAASGATSFCRTPLFSIDLITLLLGAGANVHQTNHKGKSALDHAKKSGNREVIDLLVSYGGRK